MPATVLLINVEDKYEKNVFNDTNSTHVGKINTMISGFYPPKSGIKIGRNFLPLSAQVPPLLDLSTLVLFGLLSLSTREFC